MTLDSDGIRQFDIAITGGGCSGALVAAQLFRNGFSGHIGIIEIRSRLGFGLAYSTGFDQHLLNVPAGNMSAIPGEPGHFVDWLRARQWPGAGPCLFAPRKIYGQYLEDVLHTSARTGRGRFSQIRGEVVDIHAGAGGVALRLKDGSTIEAAKAVLAIGNPASSPLEAVGEHRASAAWHSSPWIGNALAAASAGEKILLVGTGLTAVDAALALHSQTKDCKVYMISRRGLLPQAHNLSHLPGTPPVFEEPGSLRMVFRRLRDQIRSQNSPSASWRTAVDALRPVSNAIWRDLPLRERRRFLRHLRTYWESHRHRMAPQAHRLLEELVGCGKIELIAGRIRESNAAGAAIEVRVSCRRGGERLLIVDRAINCTGIHEDYHKSPRRFIRALIQKGLATANDLGIGFRTDESGALIGSDGRPSAVLFTLGPPRRGELFETSAVPEIRIQAEALARHLISSMSRAAAG